MTAQPGALLGDERGPGWSLAAQQRVSTLFSSAEAEAAADWLAAAQRDLGLSERALGALAAALSQRWTRQEADQLLWRQLATVQLALHCDFYETVQVNPLSHLCGGFIQQRLRHADSPLYEAASLVQVWCVRLTGLPMTYDYLTADELDRFAGIVARYAADILPDPDDQVRLLRGVARTLQAHVWRHGPSFLVPTHTPPSPGTEWETVSWEEGQDAVFLYPPG